MNIKDVLGLQPILTSKFGPMLAKFAQIIWYITLGMGAIGLLFLLVLLFKNPSGFIFGLVSWVFIMTLARVACEALANVK